MALTAAGEEITARARTMLESADAIVGLAQTRRDPLAGQLRLALLPTVGPYLLPLVALKIRKALPRLELMLFEYQTGPMLERLHNGDIDVGILALPVQAEGLATRVLYEEPFVQHCRPSHRLAARAQLRVEDLNGETLLLLEDGHCLRDQALAICSRSGIHEKQDFRATSHRDTAADGRHRRRRHAAARIGGAWRLRCRQGPGGTRPLRGRRRAAGSAPCGARAARAPR